MKQMYVDIIMFENVNWVFKIGYLNVDVRSRTLPVAKASRRRCVGGFGWRTQQQEKSRCWEQTQLVQGATTPALVRDPARLIDENRNHFYWMYSHQLKTWIEVISVGFSSVTVYVSLLSSVIEFICGWITINYQFILKVIWASLITSTPILNLSP